MNCLTLAYIGGAVYELFIRNYLVQLNIGKVKDLQKKSLEYVSAKSQSQHLDRLMDANMLTDAEIEIYKTGRNAHTGKRKNIDVITYHKATGLECLIGSLYLNQNYERIKEIMNFIVRN